MLMMDMITVDMGGVTSVGGVILVGRPEVGE